MLDPPHEASGEAAIQPLRVFLCHSSSDKPAVRELYQRLRADGFDPWIDEDLLPGEKWEKEILDAIHTSGAVIVCLSPASIIKEGYVQKEIKYALDVADEKPEGTIFLIPLKLEECEVPRRLREIHVTSLAETGGYEELVSALKKRSGGKPSRSQPLRPSPAQAKIEGHLFSADRFSAQGEYAQAISELEKILELDASHVDARRRLVRAALHQLTWKAFPPDYPGISIGLRSDYSRFASVSASEINRALAHVYKLQAQDASLRDDAVLLLEEAMLLKTNGARIGEAVKVLERAHRVAPGNSDVSAELGLLLAVPEESARKPEGIALLRQSVESRPGKARYHFYLARALSDVYLCWAAGLESGCNDEPEGCAEAIREFHRAADLASGTDIWSKAIRIWANRQAMDIFHRYACKERNVLTGKLAMPLEERLKEIEYLISSGASGSQMGKEDNPKFWIPQLHYAIGNLDAADRQIRDLLQDAYDRELKKGSKYWEDESYVQLNSIYFLFFAKVLKETGRDPDILLTISRFLQAQA